MLFSTRHVKPTLLAESVEHKDRRNLRDTRERYSRLTSHAIRADVEYVYADLPLIYLHRPCVESLERIHVNINSVQLSKCRCTLTFPSPRQVLPRDPASHAKSTFTATAPQPCQSFFLPCPAPLSSLPRQPPAPPSPIPSSHPQSS